MIGKIIGIVMAIILFLGIANTVGFLNIPVICDFLKTAGINPGCSGRIEPREKDGPSVQIGRVQLYNDCRPDWDNFDGHLHGTIKNDGNTDAKDVTIDATYYRNLIPIFTKTISIGDLSAGEQKDYDERFTLPGTRFPNDSRCNVNYRLTE